MRKNNTETNFQLLPSDERESDSKLSRTSTPTSVQGDTEVNSAIVANPEERGQRQFPCSTVCTFLCIVLSNVKRVFRQNRGLSTISFVLYVSSIAAASYAQWVLSYDIPELFNDSNDEPALIDNPVLAISLYGGLLMVEEFLRIWGRSGLSYLSEETKKTLANSGMRELYNLKIAYVELEKDREDIVSDLIESPDGALQGLVVESTNTVAEVIKMLIIVGLASYKYGKFAMGAFFALITTYAIFTSIARYCNPEEFNATDVQANGQLLAQVLDMINHYRTTRMSNASAHELELFEDKMKKLIEIKKNKHGSRCLRETLQGFVSGVSLLLVLRLAGQQVVDNDSPFDINDFTLILTYTSQVIPSLKSLSTSIASLLQAVEYMKKYETRLNEFKRNKDDSKRGLLNNENSEQQGFKIEFKNVTFRYPNTHRDVLKDLDFTINPGEKVGILGLSGAGKSTLVTLLLGIHEPSSGEILIDGENLNSLDLKKFHQKIGYVPSETPLFQGKGKDLQYNVQYGFNKITKKDDKVHFRRDSKELGEESYKNAIKKAGLGEDKKNRIPSKGPQDNPFNFSSGEKQRIGLARAVLKERRLYIFDEATSALDMETEKRILEEISEATRDGGNNVTVLVVAHRLTSLKGLSRLLVLKEGKISEEIKIMDEKKKTGKEKSMVVNWTGDSKPENITKHCYSGSEPQTFFGKIYRTSVNAPDFGETDTSALSRSNG